MGYNAFTVAFDLSNPGSPAKIDYMRLYYSAPSELISGKSPRTILDESLHQLIQAENELKTKVENEINIKDYLIKCQQSINTIFGLLTFYPKMCEEYPELKRACPEEDIKSFEFHYKIIERTKKELDDFFRGKYKQKELIKKTQDIIQNIRLAFLLAVQSIRMILFTYEKQLHEPLTPEAYHPDNSISH